MLTGVEFLLPSVPLGGVGSYSAAGSICPNLCTELFEACIAGEWPRARELQFKMSRLWPLFQDQYPSSLKGGMVIMGRPVGPTRAPLPTATRNARPISARDSRSSASSTPSRTAGRSASSMTFEPGLVHTPLTPFTSDRRIDFDVYARSIDFHLRHGADALAVPMHCGESVSLTDAERRAVIAFAVEHAAQARAGHRPCQRRRHRHRGRARQHAQAAGAAAIVATTPYYWTPPPAMVLEHFVQIGAAVDFRSSSSTRPRTWRAPRSTPIWR